MFRYGQLWPASNDLFGERNAPLVGPNTLGIEVTDWSFAAACGLGNIDPQHDGMGGEQSAIEACLGVSLPPIGSILVTIRPDLDSLGAMALLELRSCECAVTGEMRARVTEVGVMDRHAYGPWPGPRSLPTTQDIEDLIGNELSTLGAAAADTTRPMEERVRLIERWLKTGHVPSSCLASISAHRADLVAGLSDGRIRVGETAESRIATVESELNGALRLGYRIAPVVVAHNPRFCQGHGPAYRKFTVSEYGPGFVDIPAMLREVQTLEVGWGGSSTIIGSPQGRDSRHSMSCVVEIVEAHLIGSMSGRSPPSQPSPPKDLEYQPFNSPEGGT